jgi:protein-tyrosine phosphatase
VSDRQFHLLMVCTGNICRSPVMERLFLARLRDRLGAEAAARFVVASAGTWAMTGEPMAGEAAETLVSLGGDPSGFIARDLEVEMIAGADLILAATRDHRRVVVTTKPSAAGPTLTLREFARLLGPITPADVDARVTTDDPVERMTAIVALALSQRGLVPLGDPADDDIADPYRAPRSAYLRAASEIESALAVPLALLAAH